MKETTKYLLLLLHIAFFLLSSCSRDSSSDISESDGNITLQLIDTLGVDSGEENYVFGNIVDAVFLSDGGIVLLDVLLNKISIFSSNGILIDIIPFGRFTEPDEMYKWGADETFEMIVQGNISTCSSCYSNFIVFSNPEEIIICL